MRTYAALICAIALMLASTMCMAATTATVDVFADVDEQLDLTVRIVEVQDDQDPGTEGTEVSNMTFGSLTDTFANGTSAGNLFSRTWFAAFLTASTSGRQYIIRQTSDGLRDGTNSIPDNCYLMVPDYIGDDEWVWTGGSAPQDDDNNPPGSLGSAGPAKGTNKVIYTSNSQGLSSIIRCYYIITNGWKDATTQWPGFSGDAIPLDQPAGDYSGSVTFSIVLY